MPDGLHHRSPLPKLDDRERCAIADGLMLATIVASDGARVELSYPGMPGPATVEVSTTLALTADDVGVTVVVGFLDGRRERPIVLGRLREPHRAVEAKLRPGHRVVADGERVYVEADKQLVLSCGEASITLQADGRVLVRGTYVETRAKGVNRIRGGAVAIN
ncbi:hypothetical protein ENSA5_36410 [Enhygromyxa salina]|uniref:DUF6484 domain-containing protein n=1 Tax=Enhygromyxa salina TaxID=215803 RepID=A0A2S9XUM7_9BACT|nr:DUF6484 domain-containing protein [Enhygromyxa salina]PRP96565.1 hypothetical protein ENSA5_36410 [Enhygromyxa salina]